VPGSWHAARRAADLGLAPVEVAVPQAHASGAEAEADFAEFHAAIAGTLAGLRMFMMRLSHPGRALHAAVATGASVAG
jgi:hypothetical protein